MKKPKVITNMHVDFDLWDSKGVLILSNKVTPCNFRIIKGKCEVVDDVKVIEVVDEDGAFH